MVVRRYAVGAVDFRTAAIRGSDWPRGELCISIRVYSILFRFTSFAHTLLNLNEIQVLEMIERKVRLPKPSGCTDDVYAVPSCFILIGC